MFVSSSDGKRSSKTLLHSPPSRGNYRSLLEAGHLEAGRFCRASEQACRGSCSSDWGPWVAAAMCAEVARNVCKPTELFHPLNDSP